MQIQNDCKRHKKCLSLLQRNFRQIPEDFTAKDDFSARLKLRTIRSCSELYSVYVMCNSYSDDKPTTALYQHYINGRPSASEVPEKLSFDGITSQENLTFKDSRILFLSEKFRLCHIRRRKWNLPHNEKKYQKNWDKN